MSGVKDNALKESSKKEIWDILGENQTISQP